MNLNNQIIDGEHALEACQSFLDINEGDTATKSLIIAIFCELFDCSQDELIENLTNRKG